MNTAGELRHAFTPTFSWLVLVVLVGALIVGFLIAMSNVDYRRTVETIVTDGKKATRKTSLHFYTAPTALRVAYAILAYIACEVVVLKEHGDGILQWEFNHAGAAASEGVVLFATIVLIGMFSFAYASLAFVVFGFGTKVKLFFADIFAIGKVEIVAEERPTIAANIVGNRRRKRKAAQAARNKSVAKQSSTPARKATRVPTRASAV
ncbi:hypothetical protein IK110_00200 [Candidatus Saccharibacteria bacterium]|nr:hypothetical protein [Candidatus Saccharibacteria bacterium]